MNEQLRVRLKNYAGAPLLAAPEKEALIKDITGQIFSSKNGAEGMDCFITWWTNVAAFKQVADILAYPDGKLTLGLIRELETKAEILASNIDIAYKDLQIWAQRDQGQ